MSAALCAGTALMALVVLSGNGSASRLRAPVERRSWPARRPWKPQPSYAGVGLEVAVGLSLELRSGRDLSGAFSALAAELSDQPEVASRLEAAGAAAGAGDPVSPALTGGRSLRMTDELRSTAACCDAARDSGLPLADVLDTVADAARSRASLLGRAKAELAGARSTSVVLACLPLAGFAMGQLLGARPAHVLLGTPWGLGCLAGALVLTTVGLLWTRLITASVRRSLP